MAGMSPERWEGWGRKVRGLRFKPGGDEKWQGWARDESMVEQKSQSWDFNQVVMKKWPELSLWSQVVMKNGQSWDLNPKLSSDVI